MECFLEMVHFVSCHPSVPREFEIFEFVCCFFSTLSRMTLYFSVEKLDLSNFPTEYYPEKYIRGNGNFDFGQLGVDTMHMGGLINSNLAMLHR